MFAKLLVTALTVTLVVAIAANRSDGAGPEVSYVVKPYDTLWTIAASHYGGDPREAIWQIQRRNHVSGSVILPGQVLRLP